MRSIATTLIVLLGFVATVSAQDKKPAEELKGIKAVWTQLQTDFAKEYRAAKTPQERAELAKKAPQAAKYAEQALTLAEKNTKEPEVAIEALFFVVSIDRSSAKDSARTKALGLLTKEFAGSEMMPDRDLLSLAYNANGDDVKALLRAVAEKNKKKELAGIATFGLAQGIRNEVRTVERIKGNPEFKDAYEKQMGKEAFEKLMAVDTARELKTAEKMFETIADKYKDVEIPGRARAFKLGPRAEANLFEMRNLTIGKTVPNEELVLLDGKKVKLSDLRGKVVVLDFWATWCGPCIAMIPHEREMVKDLSGKPFMLMSISADEQKDTLTKFLDRNEMPWTHVHNGAEGGIVGKWNISYFPTIYVVDAKGVIRYKDIRNKQLEEAVHKLLKEQEEDAKKSS